MSGEKMNDLQLPMTCVTRLIKESLPENAQVKNEAKAAIAKSASVFVLFLTSAVTEITQAKGQKTVTADHVLSALKNVEFDHMLPELEASLQNYRKIMKTKKDRKSLADAEKSTGGAEMEVDGDDDVEVIDD